MTARPEIIAIGPLPPPTNGFSVITARVIDALKQHAVVHVTNTAPPPKTSAINYHLARASKVLAAAGMLVVRAFGPVRTCYLPCEGGLGLVYTLALASVARVLRYRIALHHHSFSYISRRSRIMQAVVASAGRGTLHIFLCDAMGDQFARQYPGAPRGIVLSNAAFIDSAAHGVVAAGELAPCIGLLSNLNEEKGLHLFLEVMTTAARRGIPLRGILAGPVATEADRAAIATAIATLGDRLAYWGPAYGEDKQRFFASIDLFVFPTRYANEAEPAVVFEAMAAGATVLAFDRGCIGCQVGDCGVVVPQNEDFVERTLAYLADDALRAQHRALVAERYERLRAEAKGELDKTISVMIDA